MVRNVMVSLLVLVASVVSFNIPAPAVARQAEISGCGDYFSIESIGLEGRVESESLVAGARYIHVGLANVTDESVTVPVESDAGVWQLQIGAEEPVDYDEQLSVELSRESLGDELRLDANGQGTMILVFRTSSRGDLTLRHTDLGGELGRDGVPVCSGPSAAETGTKPQDDEPASSDDGDVEPTATPGDVEPTATPRRATATPRPTSTTRPRATDTPRPRPTATPRRATATPASRGSTARAVADRLIDSPYRFEEYFLDEPYVAESDCDDIPATVCVISVSDDGATAFFVFDSSSDCRAYVTREGIDDTIYTSDHLGYDYYWLPSYLSDDGSSLAVAPVGQILVVSLSERSDGSQFSDPDVNAIGLIMAGISRADRLG